MPKPKRIEQNMYIWLAVILKNDTKKQANMCHKNASIVNNKDRLKDTLEAFNNFKK